MIGEVLYHDTTPSRGAHDGRCVNPRQQQPDMPLAQEPSKTCSSRSANAILDRIQPVEDLDASSGALKLASVYFLCPPSFPKLRCRYSAAEEYLKTTGPTWVGWWNARFQRLLVSHFDRIAFTEH